MNIYKVWQVAVYESKEIEASTMFDSVVQFTGAGKDSVHYCSGSGAKNDPAVYMANQHEYHVEKVEPKADRDLIKTLPGSIKVRISENSMGHITLTPISERVRKTIITICRINGAGESFDATVYIQLESDIEQFKLDFPRAVYSKRTGEINDGAVILMDSWTYRQYCGYQTD